MNSLLVVLIVLAYSANSFLIVPAKSAEVSAIPWPFTVCGTGSWTIESLTMNSLPARNTNNNIIATGTAQANIAFQKVNLEAKLNGVFLHSEVVDYRNIYEEGDTVEFKYKNFVPAFAPAGNYQIIFNFVNTAGNPEGCLSLVFKL